MTLRRDAQGTVMVETLFAFMPLFMLFLGIVQYTMLVAAQLVVHHAAVAGVRAASVTLDDDPARYEGAEELSIAGTSTVDAVAGLAALASAVLQDPPDAPVVAASSVALIGHGNGPRMTPIRNAVYAKLAAIVPARALATLAGQPGVSVLDGLGTDPAQRLVQAPFYLPVTTRITFPVTPGSTEVFQDLVNPTGLLTLRVSHDVTCTVPLVAAIMCSMLEAPALKKVRGVRLEAEASIPLQRAPYAYKSQKKKGSS